ncbi:ATP-dependent DNA helicase UvrD2 [Jiangella aurantiaca]|uniref:DNA 3'-5' helicase n=1 Tax=Jiangella aurantiaca TaxID=2530373 RepID=A0A4R5AA03_9ACTN|nr:ATP-dependent DNA helicase UvrD2 [Jiangella aurantiaca]TDD69108.1 ATP-dependent DNA helicase UvrD2 [Jiangella aurantiaca]
MRAPDVLAGLDPEQRAVATALSGPVCVIAGAGTGKTRAITHRIAHGVHTGAFDPRRTLAVTFTTRAAGEMRGRLRALGAEGVQARTFHSAALRQARYFWPQITGSDLPEISQSKLPIVGSAASRCRVPTDRTVLRDLASEIEWAKVSNVLPEAYVTAAEAAHREVGGVDPDSVARVYAAYEDLKTDRNVLDMEDILLAAVGLLSGHPGVAEAVRSQYHHFVVDEYQDVSPVQQKLLDLWMGERTDVCVVGDPAQTIYSFAGAQPDYLVRFPQRFPGAIVVRLFRDYRSTPEVVGVANGVLRAARDSHQGVVLEAQRPPGPKPVFVEHADELAEAAWVADQIAKLVANGTPQREIAVLFRVNAQSEAYEQALADAGVAYIVRGAERFFDRGEVRQAAMLLRAAVRTADGAPDAPDAAAATSAVLSAAGWTPTPPAGGGAARERWESLAALVSLAEEVVAAKPGAGLADVVDELEARATAQHAPVADGVTLASLHSAKGLEWDAVFVVGCHEGTLPLSYAETPAQIEEERRLLYVGITRAREHLSVSWSLARQPGGRGNRRPSRFLDGVRPGGGARSDHRAERGPGGKGRRSGAPARCRVCGAPLVDAVDRKLGRCGSCPSSMDDALFETLRAWRLERSQEQKVPAYVVFTDATLIAIAETTPVNETQLSAIPGVGRTKLDRYGAEVLELCREVAEKSP